MKKKYNHVILGGTFDRFHKGHELFVRTALNLGQSIEIGITTEPLYRHKLLHEVIEPYSLREKNIRNFVKSNKNKNTDVRFTALKDMYGTSLDRPDIDAIIVTQETKKGANMINKKRVEVGMKPLDIILVPWVYGIDKKPVSSERIRYGDIDKSGENYYKFLTDRDTLYLPRKLRPYLRKPLGRVYKGDFDHKQDVVKQIIQTIRKRKPPMVYAIGDIITASLRKEDFIPPVSIIDLRSRREALLDDFSSSVSDSRRMLCPNPPGTITTLLCSCIKTSKDRYMKQSIPALIKVKGEEDLTALPAILLAPLDSIVLYGQLDIGVVSVFVTESIKKKVYDILNKFTD